VLETTARRNCSTHSTVAVEHSDDNVPSAGIRVGGADEQEGILVRGPEGRDIGVGVILDTAAAGRIINLKAAVGAAVVIEREIDPVDVHFAVNRHHPVARNRVPLVLYSPVHNDFLEKGQPDT
jgi:hypothetical protein